MNRRTFVRNVGLAALGGALAPTGYRAVGHSAPTKPNFVIIFIDDMGYGDIEPFGSTTNHAL